MKYNPHNFKEGDTVILDEKYNNSSLVIILHIKTTGLLSCVVPTELEPPYEKGGLLGCNDKSFNTIKTNRQ